MKTEDEIKKIMENIKNQLPDSQGNDTIFLQAQFATLRWVLAETRDGLEKEDEQ
jgi:hypothetical protein